MKRNELIEVLRTVFQVLEMDILIKEYEDRMKEKDESGQCD